MTEPPHPQGPETPDEEDYVVTRSDRGPISQGGSDEMVVFPGPRPKTPRPVEDGHLREAEAGANPPPTDS